MARPKEFDRDKALESALATFRKNGFGATTTDNLRLAMGIGRQSFYDTFKGKKEIYLEALRKYNSDRMLGYFEIFRNSFWKQKEKRRFAHRSIQKQPPATFYRLLPALG